MWPDRAWNPWNRQGMELTSQVPYGLCYTVQLGRKNDKLWGPDPTKRGLVWVCIVCKKSNFNFSKFVKFSCSEIKSYLH